MRRLSLVHVLAGIVLSAATTGCASAQARATRDRDTVSDRSARWLEDCRDDRHWGDDERVCEVRDYTVDSPSRSIDLDPGPNGSVTVHGWDKPTMLVHAMVQASGESESDARDAAKDVTVRATSSRVSAEGPSGSRHRGWSVSYEIYLPRSSDLDVRTSNGSVSLDGVRGREDLTTSNGSIHLDDVSGDVRAESSNGSITANLTGTTWNGAGFDVRTSNGSVTLRLPDQYNARLEASTRNGGMNIDFPVTIQGRIGRELTTTLGSGGPTIHVQTNNGSVRVSRP